MTHSVKTTVSVFSPKEMEQIQNIYLAKELSPKDLMEVKKTLRDCLIAMVEYRCICSILKGSEFVTKGGFYIKRIKEGEAKLESFGILSEGDFRILTVLLVRKSELFTPQSIKNAIREALSD